MEHTPTWLFNSFLYLSAAVIAEQSIGKLFTAAIIPGITQALFYALVIWLLMRVRRGSHEVVRIVGPSVHTGTIRRGAPCSASPGPIRSAPTESSGCGSSHDRRL